MMNFQDLFILGLEEVFKVSLHNHCIFDVKGRMEIERFKEAVLRTLDLYPIMRMRPKTGFSLKHLSWVLREPVYGFESDVVGLANLDEQKAISDFINAPIKFWEELPFKILLVKKGKDEYIILIKVHHYATDGIGAVCFVNTVLEQYNRMVLQQPGISGSATDRVRRGMLSVVPHAKLFREHFFLRNISDMIKRYTNAAFFPSVRIAGGEFNAQGSVNVLHRSFRPGDLAELRKKAKTAQVKLNDLFITASIMAIDEWNSRHVEESGRISIEIPVNLRPAHDFYKWVGNWCSSISISARPRDRADFSTLLEKVSSQTKYIFENGLAYTLVYMSAWTKYLPFGIIKCLSRTQVGTGADTMVLSYLGKVMRFRQSEEGVREVTSAIIFGPACLKVGCSMCLYLLRNELNISFVYRDSFLTTEEAGEFLELLVDCLMSHGGIA
jgi:NRPS condensation-like uncharacterized protein